MHVKNNLLNFKCYYEANVSPLVLFARRFVSFNIAEDIVHDVFLEVWNHSGEMQQLPSPSYLFMAVRNRCFNQLKREQVEDHYIESAERKNRILGLDYYETHEKRMIEREDLQMIYDEIDRLPDKCRAILKMSYLEEKKNAEIAEELQISIRTVEHQLYLGLKTLRGRLNQKGKKRLFFMLFF